MKKIITILIIFVWTNSYGQFDKLKGTWISSSQDLICIRDTNTIYEYNGNVISNKSENNSCQLSIQFDTLKFFDFYGYRDSTFKDPYFLKILYQSDSILIVRPITNFSRNFFQNRESIKFVRQEYSIDTTIIFEKIVYHTTNDCLHPYYCPEINMQIDNHKNVYLDGVFYKENYEIDSNYTGQFTGTLTNQFYDELINLIRTCNLKTLTFSDKWYADDSPERTFIIYFNGQRKYLKSTVPPRIVDRLIEFLDIINSRIDLKRTNEKINLEK